MQSPEYDVVVVGAGASALAMCWALAQAGRRVVLAAPRQRPGMPGETWHARVREPLERLGLWHRFLALGPVPCGGSRSSWGGPEIVQRDALLDPYGSAWHIDPCKVRSAWRALLAERGVAFAEGDALRVERAGASGWTVRLAGEARPLVVSAHFLVLAAPGAAGEAARLGGEQRVVDRMVAVLGAAPAGPGRVGDLLAVESVRDGWWYASPIPGGRRCLVWLTDAGVLAESGVGDLACAWSRSSRSLKGSVRECGRPALDAPPRAHSVLVRRWSALAGPGWLRVGSGAYSPDPLSGQGALLALMGVVEASEALAATESQDLHRLDARGYDVAWSDRITEHIRHRGAVYAREGRWPESPFWRRRAAAALTGAERDLGR